MHSHPGPNATHLAKAECFRIPNWMPKWEDVKPFECVQVVDLSDPAKTSFAQNLHHTSCPTWRESTNSIARPGRPLRILVHLPSQQCLHMFPLHTKARVDCRGWVAFATLTLFAAAPLPAGKEANQPITEADRFAGSTDGNFVQLATKTSMQTIGLLESTNAIVQNFAIKSPDIGRRNS